MINICKRQVNWEVFGTLLLQLRKKKPNSPSDNQAKKYTGALPVRKS